MLHQLGESVAMAAAADATAKADAAEAAAILAADAYADGVGSAAVTEAEAYTDTQLSGIDLPELVELSSEIGMLDDTVSANPAAASFDLSDVVPAGAVIIGVQLKLMTAVTGASGAARVGLGTPGNASKYGMTAGLAGDTASIGAAQVVHAGGAPDAANTPCGLAALDSSWFVAAYKGDGGDGTAAYSRVVTVSGSAFTVGPEFEVSAAIGTTNAGIRVAALSPTLVVYAYHNGVTIAARAGVVSGDDITLGAEVGVSEGMWNGFYQDVVALDSAKFAVVSARFGVGGGNRDVTAIVGSVSGAAITLGAAKTVESIASTGTSVASAAIDPSRLLIAYMNVAALGASVICRVATVSGLDLTVGPALAAAPSDSAVWSVTPLTSTKLVVLFKDSAPPRHRAVVATVSGADATFGSVATWGSGGATWLRSSRLTDSTFVVSSPSDAAVAIGTVSGASVAFGATTSISAIGSQFAVAGLAASRFFVLGVDSTDAEGAAGTLDAASGLTISTIPDWAALAAPEDVRVYALGPGGAPAGTIGGAGESLKARVTYVSSAPIE